MISYTEDLAKYKQLAWQQASYYNKDALTIDTMIKNSRGNVRGTCALALLSFIDDSIRDLFIQKHSTLSFYTEVLWFVHDYLKFYRIHEITSLYEFLRYKHSLISRRDLMIRFYAQNTKVDYDTLAMMFIQLQ